MKRILINDEVDKTSNFVDNEDGKPVSWAEVTERLKVFGLSIKILEVVVMRSESEYNFYLNLIGVHEIYR